MKPLPSAEDLNRVLDYAPDTGIFTWKPRGVSAWDKRWAGAAAFISNTHGYRTGSLFGARGVLAHRIAWKMFYGADPQGEVDHINGDRADNRISNLRVVTSLENKRNSRIPGHNSSGIVGVRFRQDKGRWNAFISIANRTKNLGYFDSAEAARAARKQAERELGFHPNHGRSL